MTEKQIKIDNSLRTRAAQFNDKNPQEAFNLWVDRNVFSLGCSREYFLSTAIAKNYAKELGVDGYRE